MTGNEVQWLKEVFDRHIKDQQTYLEDKFSSLEKQIEEVKEITEGLNESRLEDVRDCGDCRLCLETQIHNAEKESIERDTKTDNKVLVLTLIGGCTLLALGYGVYGDMFLSFVGKILTSFLAVG
jgi:hypothetical protein